MAEVIKETVVSQEGNTRSAATSVKTKTTGMETVEYVIYFILGVLEVLLSFRLVLKLAGASLVSGFVRFIYGITGIFIMPFEGIFRRGYASGVETTSVLEPSTIVAMIVYAVVIWGIVTLVRLLSRQQPSE